MAPRMPPTIGPTTGIRAYSQSDEPLPGIGSRKWAMRGMRSRAGLIAYPVGPPNERPIAKTSRPMISGASPPTRLISLGGDGDDPEDEHEGADDLADEVERWVADRRARAEDRELQTRILGLLPVMAVMHPHQDRPDERSHQLTADVRRNVGPVGHADDRQPKRHRGVEVRAVELTHGVDGHRDGHRPPEGDHDPATVLGLRLGQQHAGDDAVSQRGSVGLSL